MSGNENAMALVRRWIDEQLWGSAQLIFQGGQIVRIIKEESIVPNPIVPDNRRNRESSHK
jgi:hypothetical protein